MVKHLWLGIFLVLISAAIAGAKMVSIKGDDVNLRKGPGKEYRANYALGHGFPLKVVQTKGDWIKVSDFEGDTGWVYKKFLSNKPHLIVKKDGIVNIRSGPGTKYRVLRKAKYGVVFRTLKQAKGWAKVKYENGLVGWVKRELLWGW